jgi:hypothetical protein
MQKIIVALDGLKYSQGAAAYSIFISKQTGAHLVGVFLDDITYHSYKIYELITSEGVSEARQRQLEQKDADTRAAAVHDFEKACQKEGVHYTIHRDRNIALQELLHESIYADLLVVDMNETLTHYTENSPTRFMRDLLESVQCPVLLVPKKFRQPDKFLLLYDGSPSAVFAIRMFGYTMSPLNQLPVDVLTVKYPGQVAHVPDNRLMKEFMKRHFDKAVYKVLKGLPEQEITQYIKNEKENTVVVLGAYRRGKVSRWFRQSMADVLMKETKVPLFVAHH